MKKLLELAGAVAVCVLVASILGVGATLGIEMMMRGENLPIRLMGLTVLAAVACAAIFGVHSAFYGRRGP